MFPALYSLVYENRKAPARGSVLSKTIMCMSAPFEGRVEESGFSFDCGQAPAESE